MTIGERIRQIRGSISQKEFAVSIGVAQNTLGNYERGGRTPNADIIIKITQNYDISFDWILLGTGPKKNTETFDLKQTATCKECQKLRKELEEERKLVREMIADNRELAKQLFSTTQKNVELHEERAKLLQKTSQKTSPM